MIKTKKILIVSYLLLLISWFLVFELILEHYLNIIILPMLLIMWTFLVKDYVYITYKNKKFDFLFLQAPLSIIATIYYYNLYTPMIIFSITEAVINIWWNFKYSE